MLGNLTATNTAYVNDLLQALSTCTVGHVKINTRDNSDGEKPSLSYRYHPDKYSFSGEASLSCCGRQFLLTVLDAKRFLLSEIFSDGRDSKITFPDNLCRSNQAMNLVNQILTKIQAKRSEILATLHDTKNFGSRINVQLKDHKPFVHAECFDPVSQKYYQMEGFVDEYHFTISSHSSFMKKYLGRA